MCIRDSTHTLTKFYVVEVDFDFRVVLPATEDTQTSCPFPAAFITGTALRAHSQVPLTFTVCVYVCVYVCVSVRASGCAGVGHMHILLELHRGSVVHIYR